MKSRKSKFKGWKGVGKPKREWDPGQPVHLRPIYGIGKFYDKLNSKGKNDAKALASKAHYLPRIQIALEIARIQRASKYSQIL